METNFVQVGPRVPAGEVQIGEEDAELFRRETRLSGVHIRKFEMDDSSIKTIATSYAKGELADAASDYEVAESSFYAKSIAGTQPNFWHNTVTFARWNLKNRETKIYNIFEVESLEGELTQAVRRVRIIRNLSRIAFDDSGEPYEDVYSRERKVFERPMVEDDVHRVITHMAHITSRQRVLQSRR
jgi:hypothetical protein